MTKTADKVTAAQAKTMEWCQVIDDKVHAAIWSPDGGGYLTTYTTTEDRKGNTHTICMGQSWVSLDQLSHSWEDRAELAKKMKIKVCKVCEEE